MKCELSHYLDKDGRTIIDFHVDKRLFFDDPIWDAMELIDGVDYVYKPREIRRMLNIFEEAHNPPHEEFRDTGVYRCQLRVAKLFTVEVVEHNLIDFFSVWTNGEVRQTETN